MEARRNAMRARVLTGFGACGRVVEEWLHFAGSRLAPEPAGLPLAPEPHVAAWRGYAAEAAERGAWAALRPRLPQLQFPIRAGISRSDAYRAATRRGAAPPAGPGLVLGRPDALRLSIEDGLAGPVPVLWTPHRDDFVCLVQALSGRNEPEPVPDSMGACLVSGFNNWDRLAALRCRWLAADPVGDWAEEFRRILPHKELYQDRFLVLTDGPYSNVPAAAVGSSADEWLHVSRTLRLAHEQAHYLALRVFGTPLDRPLDEAIADYVAIVTACGRYRADWFLRFVGLEAFPNYRAGGRLENYRGRPPLSDAAFRVLQALVRAAADNLQRYDEGHFRGERRGSDLARTVVRLSRLTLEELADPAGSCTWIGAEHSESSAD